ncbi:hypothetical protein BLD44_008480 [Mastigocladus laminosus UU774]|nr:hypothetical protein B4U84_04615 [Westiellopsis prolifica IICB1]TFI54690.1 hypothetical protein BLD44_008480 [Mastigocladus laminosus UU774]
MSHENGKYQTVHEIKNIVTAFQNSSLPRCQWNHIAHLTFFSNCCRTLIAEAYILLFKQKNRVYV